MAKKMKRATGGPTPPAKFKKGKTVREHKNIGGKIAGAILPALPSIIGSFLKEGGECRQQPQRHYRPGRGYDVSAAAASHGVPVLQRAAGRYDKTHMKQDVRRNAERAEGRK